MRTARFAEEVARTRGRLDVLDRTYKRDDRGRFGSGGGSGSGRDLTETLDYGQIDAGDHSKSPIDKRLARIQRHQGFDGPAREVDAAEWDRLQAEGATPIFRGVRGISEGSTAEEVVQDYAGGELLPIRGNYGAGTYFTTNQETADKYAAGKAVGTLVEQDRAGFQGGATIHAMLAPDARVLDWRESDHLRQEVGGMGPHDTPRTPRERVLADEGRMAAALGYDAIRVSLNSEDYGDEIIVLNRSATVVRQ